MKTEEIVAQINDLQDGEMKMVSIGEKKALLVRVNGEFHAIGSKCSHYGVPLTKGILSGCRVLCPFHQACFNVITGDIEEPPALDALPDFEVRIEGENVIVSVPEEVTDYRTPTMVRHNPKVDSRDFVIIGGGAAGSTAAEILRVENTIPSAIILTNFAALIPLPMLP